MFIYVKTAKRIEAAIKIDNIEIAQEELENENTKVF